MDAIETLMTEHRLIERVLDSLTAFVKTRHSETADDKEELGRYVTFIRDFADACHHGKEEDILFAAMVEAGFPRHGGPIAVMLAEHEQGRAYVRVLAQLAQQADPWGEEDRQRLADAAEGYDSLLRQHIQKEDRVLYPMAEQRLSAESAERVSADCERYDRAKTGSGEYERLHRLADALITRHAPLAGGGLRG